LNPLTQIQESLKGRNLSEVSRKSGVAYSTVYSLANGKQAGIYADTWQKIQQALKEIDKHD
jgi:predicted transcriptional regulator